MTWKSHGRIVGLLFLLGTAFDSTSLFYFGPYLAAPHDGYTSFDRSQLLISAALIIGMGISLALIPLCTYRALSQASRLLSRGYFLFRSVFEAGFYLITAAVIAIAAKGILLNHTPTTTFALLKTEATLSPIISTAFSIGAMLLYFGLFKIWAIPRWLSVWGILATPFYFAAGALLFAGTIASMSQTQNWLCLPVALQEISMGLHLVIFGFSQHINTP